MLRAQQVHNSPAGTRHRKRHQSPRETLFPRGRAWWSGPCRHTHPRANATRLAFLPGGSAGKEPTCQCWRLQRRGFDPWVKSPGGGNGNPLQYSCLGNPMDRGAWWATVHGVAESLTLSAAHAVQHSGCASIYLQTLTFTPRAVPSSRVPDLLRVSPGCLQALPTQPKPNSSSAALPSGCWGSVKAAPPTSCQATHLGISFHCSLCVHPSLFSLQVKCCLVDLGNLLFVLTANS